MPKVRVPCPHIWTVVDAYHEVGDECGEEIEVTYAFDRLYGADRDGRRSWGTYEMEDILQPDCHCELTADEVELAYDLAIDVIARE